MRIKWFFPNGSVIESIGELPHIGDFIFFRDYLASSGGKSTRFLVKSSHITLSRFTIPTDSFTFDSSDPTERWVEMEKQLRCESLIMNKIDPHLRKVEIASQQGEVELEEIGGGGS